MPDFIPGLVLSGIFYQDAVKPILDSFYPATPHAAALVGTGSEILGFDTEMSADHDWGARLMLFLEEEDFPARRGAIHLTLQQRLPHSIRGYSTNFTPYDEKDNSLIPTEVDSGLINHRVEIFTIRRFLSAYLNFDIRQPIEPVDWLTFPEQKLRTLAGGGGEVYHDQVGLRETLARFDYYPDDVWYYLLAAGWNRIGQEEHLMGRAGMVGDEVGSAIIASRLVRDLMRLCFLMERRYAPYPKWFGKAFSLLNCAGELTPVFKQVLTAETWQGREKFLVNAYEIVAGMHNSLGITDPLPAKAASFFGRPFMVIHLHGDFAGAIAGKIADPEVKRLAEKKLVGSLDQISDNTDILSDPQWRPLVRKLYE